MVQLLSQLQGQVDILRTIDDLWDPHVRHNTLAYAAWEFGEIVDGE